MQAIILAAGMGKRLGELTRNSAKCMVEINGRRLIEYTLDAIIEAGINNVVIVVGHGSKKLQAFLGQNYRGISIHYINNPIYDKSNNIYSLLLARDYLKQDDTLLFEGDLIFDKSILINCINEPSPNVAVVAKYQSWMDGTVVILNEDNFISSFVSKRDFNWTDSRKYYKTANIYKLSKEYCRNSLIPFLTAYINAKGINEYYEEVLKILAIIGSDLLKALQIKDKVWYEIDDIQDLDIASILFASDKNKLSLMQRRFGGHWRFPKLKDFCYLINPYFPSERMVAEMINNFFPLLSQYPSGLEVQNLLASKMFGCDKSHILVGNGASELIKGLVSELEGNIGIPVPTFDEYIENIKERNLVEFHPKGQDFKYGIKDLLKFCKQDDIHTFIIINPDNPSGNFIPKSELCTLIEQLNNLNIRLILDESFVDFADASSNHSFLNSELLTQYDNLVVIKSISKSYGVPGLRLGVMASANRDIIYKVRNSIPIWNINSFAEYFLQIIGKYMDDFRFACKRLTEERERFFGELERIEFLRPIHSNTNYILCEVLGDWTAVSLTKELLNRHWILIKDCSGKEGFTSDSYVRISVKDKQDNDYIISVLRQL